MSANPMSSPRMTTIFTGTAGAVCGRCNARESVCRDHANETEDSRQHKLPGLGAAYQHPLHAPNLAVTDSIDCTPLLNHPNSTAIARRIAAWSIKSEVSRLGSHNAVAAGLRASCRVTAGDTPHCYTSDSARAFCYSVAFAARAGVEHCPAKPIEPSIGIPQKPKNREIPSQPTTELPSLLSRSGDPTDANAGIELIDLDAVQLQSLPFRARRVVVRAGAAAVALHSTNLRMRTRTRVSEGHVAYVTFGPQSQGTVNGLAGSPGFDACRRTGGGGQVCRQCRLGKRHDSATATGYPRPSRGTPARRRIPSAGGNRDARGKPGGGMQAVRLGEAIDRHGRRAACPIQ